MVKDRKTLLEQIYDGEFYPNETVVSGDPDYVTMSHQEGEEIEYIASQLNDADKVRFDKLIDLMGETEHMNSYANFAYGLRTGIMLMFELFTTENRRPFEDRKE